MLFSYLPLHGAGEKNMHVAHTKVIERAKHSADKGDIKLACEIIKAGIRKFGADDKLHYYLGLFQFKSGKYDSAITNLEQAVKIMDMNAKPHYILGKCLWMVGRKEEALVEMKRVRNFIKDHYGAILDTGNILKSMEEYESARNYYSIAARMDETNLLALKGVIDCDRMIGISVVNTDLYKRWFKKFPENSEIIKTLAKINIFQKDYQTAYEYIKKIRGNDDELIKLKIAVLKGMKKYKNLLKFTTELVKKDNEDLTALLGMADAQTGLRNYLQLIKITNRILSINPYSVKAIVLKAYGLTHLGKFKQSLDLYVKALIIATGPEKKNIKKNIILLKKIIKETGNSI